MANSIGRGLAAVVAVMTGVLVFGGCSPVGLDDDVVQLELYMPANVEANIRAAQALADHFNKANSDIEVVIDASAPEGVDWHNSIKTRLSTGEMSDLFWYSTGSLLQPLAPDQNLLNLGGEPWIDVLDDTFRATVSTEGGIYGVPVGSAMGGGIFYNARVYDELGLEVPKTWDEFMANNAKLKAAGVDPVIQSYGDDWTSQMLILSDYYNIEAGEPGWADQYTANEVNFADDALALRSWEKLQEVHDAGYFNENFASASLEQALAMLASGEGAHYPMLTFAQATIQSNHPDQLDDIGIFGVPGDDADVNGLTAWMPSAIYAPASTEHPDEVRRFLKFVATPEACDILTEELGATGPYLVEGCEVPSTAPRLVADMLPYFDEGRTEPALEFLSPVKGPVLQQISVEVGSGIRDALSGAEFYDADAAKQAQQLGLPGW